LAVGVRVESEGLPLSSFPDLFDNKVGFGVGLIANVGAQVKQMPKVWAHSCLLSIPG
jgi:hypothetical protein